MGKRLKRRVAVNQSNFISEHQHLEHLFTRPLVPLPSGECVPPRITLITSWKCSHWMGKLRHRPSLQQEVAGCVRKQTHVKNWRKAQGSCPPTSSTSHVGNTTLLLVLCRRSETVILLPGVCSLQIGEKGQETGDNRA